MMLICNLSRKLVCLNLKVLNDQIINNYRCTTSNNLGSCFKSCRSAGKSCHSADKLCYPKIPLYNLGIGFHFYNCKIIELTFWKKMESNSIKFHKFVL